jgi:PhnB protein
MSSTYPPLSPSFSVSNAPQALEFYKAAFDAVELYRLIDPETGKIGHAEMTVNGALFMLSDEYPAFNKAPSTLGGTTMRLCLQVEDVDDSFQHAIAAGATAVRPPSDQFYGHRSGCLRDPFGHEWMLFQEKEQVKPEEMQSRWNTLAASKNKS